MWYRTYLSDVQNPGTVSWASDYRLHSRNIDPPDRLVNGTAWYETVWCRGTYHLNLTFTVSKVRITVQRSHLIVGSTIFMDSEKQVKRTTASRRNGKPAADNICPQILTVPVPDK